jgi:hypothetical protein
MRHRLAGLAAILGLGLWTLAVAAVPAPEATAAAQSAARSWLAAADALDGARTWTLAAPLFQAHISRADWQQKLSASREPLGVLKSRELIGAKAESALPGAPDGAYVVMQFHSDFGHKADAVETLTTAKQPDGSWRVVGYYIR